MSEPIQSDGDGEEQDTCPDCGSINIRTQKPGMRGRRTPSEMYSCRNCGLHFDEPERQTASRPSMRPNTGLASKLYDHGRENARGND